MTKTCLLLLTSLFLLINLSAASPKKIAKETGIPVQELKNAKKAGVILNYDDLKQRLEASASDQNILLSALDGSESRTLEVDWISGVEGMGVTVFHTALYGESTFFKRAEVYIGKEMLFRIDESWDHSLGKWNSVAREHEKVAIVRGRITTNQARSLSAAEKSSITVRFYSEDGYEDAKPNGKLKNRMEKLLRLADSIRN